MNPVIQKLLGIQDLDAKILRLKAKLAEGPERLGREEADLEVHRKRHDEAAHRAKEAMRTAERKNNELDAVDEKIKELYGKLNAARTNKEYEALKHDIAGKKADFEILEEEALQQWEVSEAREAEAEREEQKIQALEDDLAEKRQEWEREATGIRTELEGVEAERGERAADVPMTWMGIYDRVLQIRGAPAVVEVVEQYCQGCQMSVTVHDVTRAIRGQEVVQCRACNRILFAETL